ncbi:protein unc-13 homolog C-like [Nematostella vectensis]|uniref:protein unc-13 homolog C-like n=1 Tax=Nematostella vectensis TaxID=45351 RepID=UPI00207760A1|nr:protein unc-13 homolog C-like [Nematostella vectensis]
MNDGFSKVHTDMDVLRHELQVSIQEMRTTINDLETSVNAAWQEIHALQAEKESEKKQRERLQESLEFEREERIRLGAYTRREKINIKNIPETHEENCKDKVISILQNELEMPKAATIMFYAVHRVGKKREKNAKPRPIIVRFVSRETRDAVFRRKKKLSSSTRYENAYITQDCPREIQNERAILIAAMEKAKKDGVQAKVLGRSIHINGQTFRASNLPPEFQATNDER